LDQESRSVIAVQGAQANIAFNTGKIRASEIAQLIDKFPDLPSRTGAFHPIFRPPGDELPERGIAALARARGAPVPVIVSISARFMPSEAPSGKLTFDDENLNPLAQEAVLWAGEYARRFKGRLREVFRSEHWGHGRPFGGAWFHLPPADYEPLPSMLAGMVLAYFARAFSDILAYEIDLPIKFPKALIVAAAGFKGNDPQVYGEEGLAEAFRHAIFNSQPFILFSRNQQKDELGFLTVNYSGIPIDQPENIVEKLLAELVKDIESAVREELSRSFEKDLGRFLEKEEELKQAQSACVSREVRLGRI
jgi:hypothetical protein